jgi:cellulose synthase/poly-beta-1,6-N-acetylglucosamine synthase-like glycosyltransferase
MTTASVVIPTRNRAATLETVLARVVPIAAAAGAEVIVADNGSTDATADVIRRAAARAPVEHVVEAVPGATRVRNAAMRAARGDVLVFVDDDAVPRDGWLAAILAPFADPRVAVVGGRVHLAYVSPPPPWWDHNFDDYLSYYDLGPAPVDLATRPWYEAPRGANMAVRRAALLEVGGFNLRLGPRGDRHTVGEESDLCLRLLARGWAVRYVPEPTVDHQIDPRRLDLAWLYRRAFWNGWSESVVGLAHRPLRKVLGLLRHHYKPFRRPYRPRGAVDPRRLRAECERREAWGYILGLVRHFPVRSRLVET